MDDAQPSPASSPNIKEDTKIRLSTLKTDTDHQDFSQKQEATPKEILKELHLFTSKMDHMIPCANYYFSPEFYTMYQNLFFLNEKIKELISEFEEKARK